MRLAVFISHPIQYYTPIFQYLAKKVELKVFFISNPTSKDQAAAGFDTEFTWDIDLLSGYDYAFLSRGKQGSNFVGFPAKGGIASVLSSMDFDAALIVGWYLPELRSALFACKLKGIPVLMRGDSHLLTVRSAGLDRLKRVFFPSFLRLIDYALYVGQRNREYYVNFGFPEERLIHSPHCIDNERFRSDATLEAGMALRTANGISADEKVVLFAGKLVPFKRPLDVLIALQTLKARGNNYRLLIAGSGPLERELIQRSNETAQNFTLLGFQNQTQMPAAYAAADVLVLPSDGRETWGLVANEALASGLPIVVSDQVGCAPDLANDGSVGRTFQMGNIGSLAAAIESSLSEPPTKTAIAAVSNRYTIELACSAILSAL